ncbi:MAG: hypothetical protein ACLT8E_07955 [Akkermansia sp.]
MAEMITDMVPSVEKVRMVTRTEATMSAIRLARGYTGRRKSSTYRRYHVMWTPFW